MMENITLGCFGDTLISGNQKFAIVMNNVFKNMRISPEFIWSKEGEGKLDNITGKWTGALGKLQRQEVDSLCLMFGYSEIDKPPGNFSVPIVERDIRIVSVVDKDFTIRPTILESLNVFSTKIKCILLLTYMLLALFIYATQVFNTKVLRKQLNQSQRMSFVGIFFQMFQMMLGSTPSYIPFKIRFSYLLSSIFALFVLATFNCYVVTDLMAAPRGFRIDNLEDLFRPEAENIIPVMREAGFMHTSVMLKPTKAYERLNERIEKFGKEKCFIVLGSDASIYKIQSRIAKSGSVLIISDLVTEMISDTKFEDFARSLANFSHNEKVYLSKNSVTSVIYTMLENFENKKKRQNVVKRLIALLEQNLFFKAYELFKKDMVVFMDTKSLYDIEKKKPKQGLTSVNWAAFESVLKLIALGWLFSFSLCFIEKSYYFLSFWYRFIY